MVNIPNAAIDKPRKEDWLFGDVVDYNIKDVKKGDSQELARGIFVADQSDQEISRMGCGSYMTAQGVNIDNRLEDYDYRLDPLAHWLGFLEYARPIHSEMGIGDPVQVGSYLQHQMDYLVQEDLIEGYVSCETPFEMKVAINRGRPIATGSRTIDWKMTSANPFVASGTSGSGHFFLVTGFDDDLSIDGRKGFFICLNSYSDDRYDNGYFYIHYTDFDKLYTKYALIGKNQNPEVIVARKLKLLKIKERQKNRG